MLLRQLWSGQRLHFVSWAIQLKPDTLSEEMWRQHGVKIIDSDLVDFMKLLDERLEARLKPEAVA